jgi:hypothetical protein
MKVSAKTGFGYDNTFIQPCASSHQSHSVRGRGKVDSVNDESKYVSHPAFVSQISPPDPIEQFSDGKNDEI